jgi:transcriptional regulator with XRE-family HTH domain
MRAVGATTDDAAVLHAEFVAELLRRRMIARLSQGALGTLMGYDRTYVNKIERGALEPTGEFARKADDTLEACGELLRRWESFNEARSTQHPSPRRLPLSSDEASADLVVQQDEAWLTYEGNTYGLRMRKRITNVGETPVSRFFIRVAVDRYPNDPRSNEWHRRHPLALDELQLHAWSGDEPMTFEVKQDRDATKEFWLLFQNEHGQFPLYPGQEAAIEYRYCVGAEKWGQWFQRAVRLPTGWLGVHLAFPSALDPSVWGVEISPAAGERPLIAPIHQEVRGDTAHFHWSTNRPPLAARYRLEWKFRGRAD